MRTLRGARGLAVVSGLSMTALLAGSATASPVASSAGSSSSSAVLAGKRTSSPLKVVVLGDSVPAGGACDCTPFGELAAKQLGAQQGRSVKVTNLAVGGSTSADVVKLLQRASVRSAVASADLVIVETGANDFSSAKAALAACRGVTACYGTQLKTTTNRIASIAGTITSLQTGSQAKLALVGYWNVFKDGSVGRAKGSNYVATSDALTRRLNASVAAVASRYGASHPDVYTALKGTGGTTDPTSNLAADGDHPNAAGHRILAATVVSALGSSAATL